MNNIELRKKVRVTCEYLIKQKGYISPVELLIEMKRITPEAYKDWRMGRMPYLERVCSGNLSKLNVILREMQTYAKGSGLKPSFTHYKKWGKGKKITLRFSKSGNPNIEKAYATHYIKKGMTPRSNERSPEDVGGS